MRRGGLHASKGRVASKRQGGGAILAVELDQLLVFG